MEINAKNIVRVDKLTSGFEEKKILDDVSMYAMKNDITVILGASGCGKTTLLKHLIRLYSPWSGEIELFGENILQMDEPEFNTMLQSIGVLFQSGALLNSITIAENIAIPLEQHTDLSRRIIDRLVRVKLGLVGLGYATKMRPSELSGGMRKRAALARAIAMDPPLLLCDEPSAGLDPVTLASLDRLLLQMRDDLGMTVLLVSHELASISRIADSVVFMDAGRVLFCGPLQEARGGGIEAIDKFFKAGEFQMP